MLNRFLAGLVSVAILITCLSAASVRSAPGESKSFGGNETTPPVIAQEPGQYIGTDRCVTCHRKQTGAWAETQHAHAFDNLPAKYREDTSCLKCHVTGFGETGGFALEMAEGEAKPYLSVGCESCHGPGLAHEEAVKRWTLSDPADEERLLEEMNAAIIKAPPVSSCAKCHTTQGHQAHPPYDGQPLKSPPAFHSGRGTTAANISLPPSPHSYSVKTCGSCHYVQYKQWGVGKHIDLSTMLPSKYSEDRDCLECHRQNLEPWDWYTPATDALKDVHHVGVGCESCHGPALKHVLFNKQFIAGPKLGAEMEEASRQTIRQGQPAAACIECHVREGHLEHPKFEKPADANSK